LLGFDGETKIIPSIEINAIDTNGAGDAFVGAVLFQLADRQVKEIRSLPMSTWEQIIANANKAGARPVSTWVPWRHLNI
jgi:fructokinase